MGSKLSPTLLDAGWARSGVATVLYALLCAACSPASSDGGGALPDVVVVTLDTTRPDHLGLYGYFRDTSPNLDRLAAESLVFDRYVVPMALTAPSHVSLFTMLEPMEHGIQKNGVRFSSGPRSVPFAEFARSAGLRTAAFVSATPLKRHSGIQSGFDLFDEGREAKRLAANTVDAAIGWLTDNDAPFFLWVHLFDPHTPYTAPPPFDQAFEPDEALAARLRARQVPDLVATRTGTVLRVANRVSRYDAEILYMDAQLGRLLDHLRARDRWSRTAVVVVGDHGEAIGEREIFGHGEIWEEDLRAPLMVRVPGVAARRVGGLVATVDVLPTLLGLAPLPGAETWLAQASGADVLAEPEGRRAVVSRSTDQMRSDVGLPTEYAVTTPRWKFVRSEDGSQRLYERERDPGELRDVLAEHPDVAQRLLATLEAELSRQRARASAPSAAGDRQPELDEETIEQLRALGYAEEVAPDPPN